MTPNSPQASGTPPLRMADWPVGVQVALLGVAYFALARAGLEFAGTALGPSVTPVWPASGFALGALIVGGLRLWPGVWLGAAAAAVSAGAPLAAIVGMATGNTVELVLTVALLRWWFGFRGEFERPHQVVGFIFIHGLVGAPVSALLGTGGAGNSSVCWRCWCWPAGRFFCGGCPAAGGIRR